MKFKVMYGTAYESHPNSLRCRTGRHRIRGRERAGRCRRLLASFFLVHASFTFGLFTLALFILGLFTLALFTLIASGIPS
jgi:hypothetical protein